MTELMKSIALAWLCRSLNLERTDTRRIIDRGVLIALDRLSIFVLEFQELDVDLYLVAWHALFISVGVYFPDPGTTRQTVQATALENCDRQWRQIL